MYRILAASLIAVALMLPAAPASADVKIVSARAHQHQTGKHVKRIHRHWHALAIPRCKLVYRKSANVHWRGLACPKIAWAGSAPRQPWSYVVFRRHARFEQHSELWQTHIRPSPTHPTIYWGY